MLLEQLKTENVVSNLGMSRIIISIIKASHQTHFNLQLVQLLQVTV